MNRTYFFKGEMLFLFLNLVLFFTSAYAFEWTFSPEINISNGYNNNIFFTYREKTEDFETKIIPKAILLGETERAKLKTDLSVIIDKYLLHPDLDMINSKNSAIFTYQISPKISGSISAFFSKDDTLTTEIKKAGIAEVRKDCFRYGFDLSGDYLFSERISFRLSAGERFNVYPDGPYSDLDLWQMSISSMYKFNPKDSIGFSISFSDASFEDTGEIKDLSGYIFLRRDLTERTYIKGGIGYRYTRTEYEATTFRIFINPEFPNIAIIIPITKKETTEDTGIVYTFSLNNNWTKRFSTILEVARKHYNSANARSVDHTYIRARFTYKLTEKAYVSYSLSFDSNDYEETEFLPEETRDYIRFSPYFRYNITENLTFILKSSYEYGDYKIGEKNYNRERFKTFFEVRYNWKRLFSTY